MYLSPHGGLKAAFAGLLGTAVFIVSAAALPNQQIDFLQTPLMTAGITSLLGIAFIAWVRSKIIETLDKIGDLPSKDEWDEHREELRRLVGEFRTFSAEYREHQKHIEFRIDKLENIAS